MAEELNGVSFRDYLRSLYETRKDRRSAFAVVLVLSNLSDSMTTLRAELPDDAEVVKHSLSKGWDDEFAAFKKRLVSYKDDVPCAFEVDDACTFEFTSGKGTPAEQANGYAYDWVMRPILDGVWPEDYYIGFGHPARADAIELASLFNRLVAVVETFRLQQAEWGASWPTVPSYVAEALVATAHELESSAPGENKTLFDHLKDAADTVVDLFKAAGSAFLWGLGIAGVAFGGWLLWKAFRK